MAAKQRWSKRDSLAPIEGESSKANAALRAYARMGPKRSLPGLHRCFTNTSPKSEQFSLRWIKEWSRKHQWQARVRAYDAANERRNEKIHQNRRDQIIRRHVNADLKAASKLRAKVSELFDSVGECKAGDLAKLLDIASKLEMNALEHIQPPVAQQRKHRPTYLQMCRGLHPTFNYPPWLQHLGQNLESVERYIRTGGEEGCGRLIVCIPPRHSKSQSISCDFSGYILGNYPDKRIILGSYGATLADEWSYAARMQVESPEYHAMFSVGTAGDSRAKNDWHMSGGGGMRSVGVGGGIIGRGGDLIIVDDAHKDFAEAHSQTCRDKVWSWYRGTLRHRFEPMAAAIIPMTRWHPQDLVGRLLENSGEDWTLLKFPALATEHDVLGRKPGDALWPERYSREELLQIKREVGSVVWAGLYQQEPVTLGGRMLERTKYIIEDSFPDMPGGWYRAWDLAVTEKQIGKPGRDPDWTIGSLGTIRPDKEGLPHMWIREQVGCQRFWPDAEKLILQTAKRDGAGVTVLLPRGGTQNGLVQVLTAKLNDMGIGVNTIPECTDKVARAALWHPLQEAGRVHLLRGNWVGPFLSNSDEFPGSAHDDDIDSVSLLAAHCLLRDAMGRVTIATSWGAA